MEPEESRTIPEICTLCDNSIAGASHASRKSLI
jgi:hypothetical protein